MKLNPFNKTESLKIQKEIISQIRDLINLKNLEPGDKLPSERMLSEKFDFSRGHIRESIQVLESYGLLKSIPQSGTFISNIGVIALNGMIEDILRLKTPSFKSLVETRIILELETAELAALRRTDEDLISMKHALDTYTSKVLNNEDAVQEDLLFHLTIAKASGNSTINTLMLMITPEVIINFEKYHICDASQAKSGIKEHQDIFEAIKNRDSELAKQKMKDHFKALYQYCYTIKS